MLSVNQLLPTVGQSPSKCSAALSQMAQCSSIPKAVPAPVPRQRCHIPNAGGLRAGWAVCFSGIVYHTLL